MPWVVGIDEAGYGPNLGPLVQAAAILWMPPEDPAGWDAYDHCFRRTHEPDDGRLLVDDSKKVYQGSRKLEKLERTVLSLTGTSLEMLVPDGPTSITFEQFLEPKGQSVLDENSLDILDEHWYDAQLKLPAEWRLQDANTALFHFSKVAWMTGDFAVIPIICTTPRFNSIVLQTDNKAAVLTQGLIKLLKYGVHAGRHHGSLCHSDDPIIFICDKQGGRHFYAPLLQEAFPDGWIVADREGPAESKYRIMNLDRDITVLFRPKADGDSVSVALASMLAKYLREICMLQFNAFWARHVPGLKSTAGYPVDAKRFYAEIEPAMESLGIAKDSVWRVK